MQSVEFIGAWQILGKRPRMTSRMVSCLPPVEPHQFSSRLFSKAAGCLIAAADPHLGS
jgi:hypothetical protein